MATLRARWHSVTLEENNWRGEFEVSIDLGSIFYAFLALITETDSFVEVEP